MAQSNPNPHPILDDMADSRGDPRDMSSQQLTQLRQFFDGSLFHFAWTFFGFKDLEASGYRPVHREVCNLLAAWGEPPTEPWHPGDRLMIQIPRGSYKCLSADSIVNTTQGPRTAGKLVPGDELLTLRHGQLTTTRVCGNLPAHGPMLHVVLRSGVEFTATLHHPVRTVLGWRNLSQLAPGQAILTAARLTCAAPTGPRPYLAGVLCGDGCASNHSLTCHDHEILEQLQGLVTPRSDPTTFGVPAKLWHPDLLHGAWDKFIPADYEGSAEFLRGLYDADGCCSGNSITLVTVSSKLARDVQRNLRYWGIVASRRRYATVGPNGYKGTAWQVCIRTVADAVRFRGSIGFSVKRKAVALESLCARHNPLQAGSRRFAVPSEWRQLLHRAPIGNFPGRSAATRGDIRKLKDAGVRIDNNYWTSFQKVRQAATLLSRPDLLELCHDDCFWDEIATITETTGEIAQVEVDGDHSYLGECVLHHNTSLCTLANGLWQVARNPDETILICNEVVDNSKKWLRAIREIAQSNRLFQAVYQDLLPPGIHWADRERGRTMPRWWKWNDQEIVFVRPTMAIPEASLTAAGVGTATTGGHWRRLIKDDLVSEDAKNSASVMEKVRQWFDSSLPLEKPPYQGKDLVVCTPWTYDDVYRYILEKYDYKLYRRSIIENHPTTGEEYTILPKQWTVEQLHKERDRDPYYFSSQLMCIPRAGKSQSFDGAWLREFFLTRDREPLIVIPDAHYTKQATLTKDAQGNFTEPPQKFPLHWCSKVLLVDPASADQAAKERKDHSRTGLVVEAVDPWGRRFLLDCWAGKGSPNDAINRIFEMAERWQLTRVGIEEITFSIVYQYWLRQESVRRHYHLSIQALKPRGRNKQDRIEQLIPGFQNGFYYLNQGAPNLQALRREYLDYPYAANRDLLDALAYDSEMAYKPEQPVFLDEDARDELSTQRDITGYSEPYF